MGGHTGGHTGGRTGRGTGAVALALLCLTVPVLAACTSSGGTTTVPPTALPPVTGVPRAAAIATAPRGTTPAERVLLRRAERILTRDCMEERGFSFWVTGELPDPVERLFPYVIDDPAWAAEHGYGRDIRERRAALTAEDPNQRYFRGLSAKRKSEAVKALNGAEPEGLEANVPGMGTVRHSDEGCESEAQKSLYTDLRTWYSARKVTEALVIAVHAAVEADPRFTRAVDRWSGCVRAGGHRYSSPAEARRTFLRGPAGQGPAEIKAATAEARCALSSGLAEKARALESAHRQDMNAQHPTEVRNREALEYGALSRARTVVENG